jgi:SAM-dependent methyltransferase
MGLGIAAIQNTLELHNLGHLKNSKNVFEIGSQELHLKKEDLKQLFDNAGLKSNLVDEYPNINNWPERPRCPSKFFYESLGIKEYQSIDINGDYGAIVHDLSKPFEDRSKFNKFDIVTDHGSCEHVFNIAECYRTMHNLTKPGGYIIIAQAVLKGNGYFKFDESFFEGIAAANSYKIIFNSYVINTRGKTKNGTPHQFHIPRNRELFNVLDFSKLEDLNIYGVLQKTKEDEFKIPYQGKFMKEVYNIPGGFNRAYFKDPMSYTYLPSSTSTVEETSFRFLIKALIIKIRRIIRIRMSKKK